MKDPTYHLVELTGRSSTSGEDAVISAIQRAYQTIRNSCWFQVIETGDHLSEENCNQWQATIRVGFTTEN